MYNNTIFVNINGQKPSLSSAAILKKFICLLYLYYSHALVQIVHNILQVLSFLNSVLYWPYLYLNMSSTEF